MNRLFAQMLNSVTCGDCITVSGRTRTSDFSPVSPETARHDPEEFIEWTRPGSRVLVFQDGELLAKGEVL
jgi:hypothetical protein